MGFPRRATVFLLAGTVLLCPYPCLWRAAAGCQATASAGDGRAKDPCCCGPASEPASEKGKDRSGEPGSRLGSGMCLCRGAVLTLPATVPGLDHEPAAFVPADDLPAAARPSVLGDGRFAVERAACHFPSADSGREVRALIASLVL